MIGITLRRRLCQSIGKISWCRTKQGFSSSNGAPSHVQLNIKEELLRVNPLHNQLGNQSNEILNYAYSFLLGGVSLAVLGIGAYITFQKDTNIQVLNISGEKDDEIKPKTTNEFRTSEKQKLIDEAFECQNPMKSYPIGQKSSNSMDQIIDYTAYGDLKFYHLAASYFYKDIDEMTYLDHSKLDKKPLTGIRQNHMASLALETERSLQNIYIKAEDLKKVIREKGFYECPGIFLRYKGFVYVRHRSKPIVQKDLDDIPNHQNLSLFEVFHRYYSPLPEVYDEHYEFILQHGGYIEDTTTLENSSWIGNVTFNHRAIPKILIKGDEKNIFMWKGKNQDEPQESRYIKIWNTMHLYPQEPAIALDNSKYYKN